MQKKKEKKKEKMCVKACMVIKKKRDVMTLWFNVDNWTALITKQEKNT